MSNVQTYEYKIDGQLVSTNDQIINGRNIRANAGLNPASDYQLIEIGKITSRSVGLEEKIDLNENPDAIFLSFKNDRAYSFTVNERGFEWGDEQISASDIRLYADIPENHELFLDSKRDRPIEDDDIVHLKQKGVERILSRKPEKICIIINTLEEDVESGRITFEELAKLAFPNTKVTPNTEYTVSFNKGPRATPEGTLIAGESVKLKKGMIFDVTETDKS